MEELTGTIVQGKTKAAFVAKDHRFVFLPVENEDETLAPGVKTRPWSRGTLHPTDSFLRGRTLHDRDILIYCTGDIELVPSRGLNTFQYIVARDSRPLEQYDAIEFVGGSLNSVFAQRSLDIGLPRNGEVTIKVKSDEILVPVDDGELESVSVFSEVEGKATDKGNSISNTGARLRVVYKKPQGVEKTVVKQYSDVLALVQFMTFRKNVSFDKVMLLRYAKAQNGEAYLSEAADCYIKEDWPNGKPRDRMRCITFNDLGPETTGKLYKEVRTRDARKSRFSVNFIPESDRESHWLKGQQVRDICTSIELEANLQDIAPSNSESFSKVIAQMREVVDASMGSDDPLTQREYDYLTGSLRHMNGPAAELAKALFDKLKPAVKPLLSLIGEEDLTEEQVQTLIKARNELTHAGVIKMSEELADVALVMMGVAYGSVLSRCGCSDGTISEFLQRGLLTV